MPTARTWHWQQKDWPEFRYNSAIPFPNEVPNLIPPTDSRLCQLTVAAASHAHLFTRNEIYPPNFPLALAHTRNALSGDELTIAEIDRRLHARLPHCPVLPPRPQLDVLLTDALELLWDPLAAQGEGADKSPHKNPSPSPSPRAHAISPATQFTHPLSPIPKSSKPPISKIACSFPPKKAATSSSPSNPPNTPASPPLGSATNTAPPHSDRLSGIADAPWHKVR